MRHHPLPYFSKREKPVSILVIHSSAHSTDQMIDILKERELSCHYIIGFDGEVTKLVDEDNFGFHAGVSYWRGTESLNQHSIGIEVSNITLGQSPYNKAQISSMISLFKEIISRHNIKPESIVAHSDIAPTRKPDPGLAFPWEILANNGIGLWYSLDDAEKTSENDVKKLLSLIGYDTRNEEATIASAYAFRRRFLPEEVYIDKDVMHLVDNVYPIGKRELLSGEKFIKTLKAVAYKYKQNTR